MLIKSPLVQKENKLVKYCFISHIILKHQHKIMKVPGKPHFWLQPFCWLTFIHQISVLYFGNMMLMFLMHFYYQAIFTFLLQCFMSAQFHLWGCFVLEMVLLRVTHTALLADVLVLCTFQTLKRSQDDVSETHRHDRVAVFRVNFLLRGHRSALHPSAALHHPSWSLCCPAPQLPGLTPHPRLVISTLTLIMEYWS